MEHIKKERRIKHLDYGHGLSRYVPYLQTTQNQTGQQVNTGAQQQLNAYTPGQQGLQGNLGGLYQSLLSGNIPNSFTNPAAATNAYNTNFQTQVAPQMAAQFGAGSPAIASQQALGLAQLQGNLYNTGVQNYMGALGQGSNYALGMPIGGSGAQQAQGANSLQGTDTSNINPLAFLASLYQQTSGNQPLFGPSDERLKKDIKSLDKEKAVEQIKKLRSVEFNWREEASNDRRLQLGFIAQEVEQVIPEAVINAEDTYLLDKGAIISVLVAAVQELTERLEKVERKE
jgi:hypothetical protein